MINFQNNQIFELIPAASSDDDLSQIEAKIAYKKVKRFQAIFFQYRHFKVKIILSRKIYLSHKLPALLVFIARLACSSLQLVPKMSHFK